MRAIRTASGLINLFASSDNTRESQKSVRGKVQQRRHVDCTIAANLDLRSPPFPYHSIFVSAISAACYPTCRRRSRVTAIFARYICILSIVKELILSVDATGCDFLFFSLSSLSIEQRDSSWSIVLKGRAMSQPAERVAALGHFTGIYTRCRVKTACVYSGRLPTDCYAPSCRQGDTSIFSFRRSKRPQMHRPRSNKRSARFLRVGTIFRSLDRYTSYYYRL